MYIHRRFVVRFLIALLVLLSCASFISIALGLGVGPATSNQGDSGTPTRLEDMSPFYVLLIGSDSLEGTALYTGNVNSQSEADRPQADSLVLTRIDPASCTVTLVTVPSNTTLEDADGMVRDSLDDGAIQTVRRVERIAGVSIRYYFLMDFSGFEAFMNQVGPITADVPVRITMQDPVTAKAVTVEPGKGVKLDEAAALAFLRSSEPYLADSDAYRQLNVRNVLTQAMLQTLALDDDAVRKVLGVFEGEVETNISNDLLISLVTRFYDEKSNVKVHACTGPYLASELDAHGELVVEHRARAWRELMSVVDSGEDPAAVLPEYDFKGSDEDYKKPETAASGSASRATSASASAAASSGTKSTAKASSGKSGSASTAGKD